MKLDILLSSHCVTIAKRKTIYSACITEEKKCARQMEKLSSFFISLFIFKTHVDLLSCWEGGSKVL